MLPEREYADEHLEGAVNVPATAIGADTVGALRRDRPVIVYCYDRE